MAQSSPKSTHHSADSSAGLRRLVFNLVSKSIGSLHLTPEIEQMHFIFRHFLSWYKSPEIWKDKSFPSHASKGEEAQTLKTRAIVSLSVSSLLLCGLRQVFKITTSQEMVYLRISPFPWP